MSNDSQTRRNLLAAASVLVTALWSRGVRARGGQGGQGGAHCFLRGTMIRTPSGEQEISTLQSGDLVVTHSGQAKPIRWIGRRSLRRDNRQQWSANLAPIDRKSTRLNSSH